MWQRLSRDVFPGGRPDDIRLALPIPAGFVRMSYREEVAWKISG